MSRTRCPITRVPACRPRSVAVIFVLKETRKMITRGKAAFRLSLLATMAMLVLVWVPPTFADGTSTQSYTGTLATSDSVFETTVTLAAGDDVVLQTYGFGGV